MSSTRSFGCVKYLRRHMVCFNYHLQNFHTTRRLSAFSKTFSVSTLKHNCLNQPVAFVSTQKQQDQANKQVETQTQEKEDIQRQLEIERLEDNEYNTSALIPMQPITSLDLVRDIKKVRKLESFTMKLFLGQFDRDYLFWPTLLRSKKEYYALSKQYKMLHQNWEKVKKDRETLSIFGFDKLHQLSISEMIHVFEGIGAAIEGKLSIGKTAPNEENVNQLNEELLYLKHNDTSLQLSDVQTEIESAIVRRKGENASIIESLIPIIIHNALCYRAVNLSENKKIKELAEKEMPKLGFAYHDSHQNVGSFNYTQFSTTAALSNDKTFWVVNGEKRKILKDDYDYYVTFCRCSESPDTLSLPQEGEFKPDDGMVVLLVPKDRVEISDDGTDSAGISYQKVKFNDVLLEREDYELIPSQQNPIIAQNIRGVGQVATAAVLLGIVKQAQRNAYEYLTQHRAGLLNCSAIKQILAHSTQQIYSMEAVIYLVSAMFDAFEKECDCQHEAQIAKIIATEFSHNIIHKLQSIYGSNFLLSSTVHDMVNILDSFLDGCINNRIYLALCGVKIAGRFKFDKVRKFRLAPFYPVYNFKDYLRGMKNRRDSVDLIWDLPGYVHPELSPQADWLEYCCRRMEYSAEVLLNRYGREVVHYQMDLIRVAQLAMDCFLMTAALSRSSNAFCNGLQNGDNEIEIARSVCLESLLRVRSTMDEIEAGVMITNDMRVVGINRRNLSFDGYAPASTLDRVI